MLSCILHCSVACLFILSNFIIANRSLTTANIELMARYFFRFSLSNIIFLSIKMTERWSESENSIFFLRF